MSQFLLLYYLCYNKNSDSDLMFFHDIVFCYTVFGTFKSLKMYLQYIYDVA